MTDKKQSTEKVEKQVSCDLDQDKEWIRSSAGQKALAVAREEIEEAVRQLESKPPVLTQLIRQRFA